MFMPSKSAWSAFSLSSEAALHSCDIKELSMPMALVGDQRRVIRAHGSSVEKLERRDSSGINAARFDATSVDAFVPAEWWLATIGLPRDHPRVDPAS